MPDFNIDQPGTRDLRQTLRCTLASHGQTAADLERQVTSFIEYGRKLSLGLDRHWLMRRDSRPVCGITCLESPGRTAMLFFPQRADDHADPAALVELFGRVAAEESQRGIRLLQVLLDPEDAAGSRLLERAGFRQIALLDYLECRVPPAAASHPGPRAPLGLRWTEYDGHTHARFAALIRRTYDGSLDCPGLSALRDIEDVMAGHRAAGLFVPRRWQLLSIDGVDAGCVLMSENPLRPTMELVYMGVAPDFRGRGVGRRILDKGLDIARAEGAASVTLAVDRENVPAARLYASAGFVRTGARRAMLRVLDGDAATPYFPPQ